MEQIENVEIKALKTYQGNMGYLAKHHPALHKKIELLEMAMQDGKYKEKYDLEYREEGYFDVRELATGEWLYGASSVEHAEKMAQEINYRKDRGVIETFYNVGFDEESVAVAMEADPAASRYITTAPVIEYVSKVTDKKKTTMKSIFKFIFLGVGLGLHLKSIDKKIGASVYLIVEDNLELFRLSLFVTDYSSLAKKSRLFFSVMENSASFRATFDAFYHEVFIRNSYLKYALFYDHYKDKIRQIQNFIVSQSALSYPHDKLLKKNFRVLRRVKEGANFTNVKDVPHESPFASRPVVLVAAGPSLGKEMAWLKKNAPHVTIVALFMTASILEKEGIKPDVVIHIDEQTGPVLKTMQRMNDPKTFLDGVPMALAPSVDMRLFDMMAPRRQMFFFEDRTKYRFKMGRLEGFSVGEIAYALTLIWGSREIYLLGLDLALDPESGKTHAEGHATEVQIDGSTEVSESVSLKESVFEVKGNFRPSVKTTPLFEMSIHRVDYFTSHLKQGYQKVFNLNDGAFFGGVEPKRPEEIDFSSLPPKKSAMREKIFKFLQERSSDEMDSDEKALMQVRQKEALKKRELVEEFMKRRCPSMEEFNRVFVDTAARLIMPDDSRANELAHILMLYLENVGGYIGDFFNTREIKNPKKHIKQMQKIVAIQFLKIIDKYIEGWAEAEAAS